MIQISIDVCVIELDGRQHQGPGTVVEKLRPLVEERAVILVALHDEVLALAYGKIGCEIDRGTPDKEARRPTRILQDPR